MIFDAVSGACLVFLAFAMVRLRRVDHLDAWDGED